MRWPLVSRDRLVAVREESIELVQLMGREHSREVERLDALLAKEQARSADLLKTILDLKLAGAALPRPLPVKSAAAASGSLSPSRIQQAIDENPIASSNPALRRHLAAWAEKELAKPGADAEAIEARLRTWAQVRADDDDDDDYEDDDELVPLGVDAEDDEPEDGA